MISFRTFITEQVVSQLKHLTHVEDHPIDSGAAGFEHAKNTLNSLHSHLSGEGSDNGIKVTEKFDGAPSVVFGRHPGTGRFFVASKSAFNKNPKINYTPEDIETNHGHAPGLVEKLKTALHELPKIAPKTGVYQGDMLFSKPDVKKEQGLTHFTPNTITYSAPTNSEEGKKIGSAKMGIVVHTKYHPTDSGKLEDMHAGFDVDHGSFNHHSDVYNTSPEIHFQGHYPKESQNLYRSHMQKAQAHHDAMLKNGAYGHMAGHDVHLNTYINSTVRNNSKPSTQGYKNFLQERQTKDVASVKTDKSKQQKHQAMQSMVDSVENHRDSFDHAFAMHHHLQQAKNVLTSALETHNRGLQYSIAGEQSKPEGFVATLKNKKGESMPSKFVNRAEFSRANFSSGKPGDKK